MRLLQDSDKTFQNCKIWSERKDTILVSKDGSFAKAEWLPKDQITIMPALLRGQRGFAHIRMSASLARDKKFIEQAYRPRPAPRPFVRSEFGAVSHV